MRVEHLNRSNEHTTFSADSCSDIIIRELGISRIVVPGPEVSIESPAPLAEDAARLGVPTNQDRLVDWLGQHGVAPW